jgi:hypothetical protein
VISMSNERIEMLAPHLARRSPSEPGQRGGEC